MKSQFLIAAPTSGSGKTTIARGLMELFAAKGMKVQPFKCGPDYIDTKFHEAVCGRPSINLDTFMATPTHVKNLFTHYGADADVCIVEGMMGLFDGYDRDRGSSAEIARLLGIPVVLVVDAKSAAYSMAALLSGFIHFRDDVRIAAVIFNKVGSTRHEQMLRQVCDDLHIECLGCVPKSQELEQGSRYLGLDFSELSNNRHAFPVDGQLTDILGKSIDLGRFSTLGVYSGQTPSLLRANSGFAWRTIPRPFLSFIRRCSTVLVLSAFLILSERFPTSATSIYSTCLVAIRRSILRHLWPTKPAARPSRTLPNRGEGFRQNVAA